MKFVDLVLEAYQKNSLIPVLMGEYPYTLEQSQYVPGIQTTDVDKVLMEGIYEAYKQNLEIKKMFEKSIKSMFDMSMEHVYMSLLYVFSQIFNESHKLTPFIMGEDVIQKATATIKFRRTEMEQEVEFSNGTKMKGFWNDVMRMDKVLRQKYNKAFIED